jgi:hypothetical protein
MTALAANMLSAPVLMDQQLKTEIPDHGWGVANPESGSIAPIYTPGFTPSKCAIPCARLQFRGSKWLQGVV